MTAPDIPSIDRIAELQQLIINFGNTLRMVPLPSINRIENDVDHSFGLALTCWFLQPKVAPKLNLQKILMYALAHDIVELHSGDTFAFDPVAVTTKADREAAALKKITADWPDFLELSDYAAGYAQKRDAEARFVYTIDKILPSLLVVQGENGAFYKRHKVTLEMHEAEKNQKMQSSPEALPYLAALNDWLREHGDFYKPGSND